MNFSALLEISKSFAATYTASQIEGTRNACYQFNRVANHSRKLMAVDSTSWFVQNQTKLAVLDNQSETRSENQTPRLRHNLRANILWFDAHADSRNYDSFMSGTWSNVWQYWNIYAQN